MVRSYLLSYLATRAAVLGDGFGQKHPGAWLVWEPGAWHAPADGQPAQRKTLVGFKVVSAPEGGDALCFQLQLDGGKSALKVGRDQACEVVINDATVSREHVTLSSPGNQRWHAEPAPQRTVKRGGAALTAGKPTPIASGDKLELGSVTCTFYDTAGLLQRIWGAKKK